MTQKAEDCIFCHIVSGDVPVIAKESTHAVAIRDIAPVAPKHFLIISRAHIPNASALQAAHGTLLAEMFALANDVAKDAGVAESGYRLVMNVGPDGGMTVGHLHLHVLGGRPMAWPPG